MNPRVFAGALLGHLGELRAPEVQLWAGIGVLVVTGARYRHLTACPLTAGDVDRLHGTLLRIATSIEQQAGHVSYRVTLRGAVAHRCEYRRTGEAACLIFRLDRDEPALVEASGGPRRMARGAAVAVPLQDD